MNCLARLFSLAALRRHALLLAFLLAAPLFALTEGDFTYEVLYGEATITEFPTYYYGALTIPSTLGGYPVRSIGDHAFEGCSSLISVVIPEGVTEIGDWAFQNCSKLTSVTIPEGVTEIGGWAFQNCSSLTSVVIPASVTEIGDRAFRGCSSLTSVTIPASVTSIGDYAFQDCSSLTSVTIPSKVTKIGNGAFEGCSSLISVVIPEGVTEIGDWAFQNCSKLTSVTIPSKVTSIGNYVFYGCSSLTSVVIPSSVKSIGYAAFYGCSSLTSVTIPSSVTSISDSAFSLCRSLTSVVIPASVTSIGEDAFYGCSSLTSVEIPEGMTSIGYRAFYGCSSLTSVTIPEGVTSIGGSAFEGCSSLVIKVSSNNTSYASRDGVLFSKGYYTTLLAAPGVTGDYVIPSSVTSIGTSAFRGCSALTSVTIPEGVTSIGTSAFRGCSALTSVTIPEGVTSIGNYAFWGCSALTSVVIPASVTSIGDCAFEGCSSLTSVTIPEGVTSIGDRAFEGCSSLMISVNVNNPSYASQDGCLFNKAYTALLAAPSVAGDYVIPANVTAIGNYAFRGCSSLTSVTIPSSVTTIGNGAFNGCSSLTSVTIPASVTSIGDSAFQGCSALTSVVIPASVTSIGEDAFYGCSSLTSVVIPESVTTIGDSAFRGCSALTSVVIPASVTSIGVYAFEGVAPATLVAAAVPNGMSKTNLTSVVIPEGVTSIGDYAFYACSSLTSVTIPSSVTSIGGYVFQDCSSLTSVTIPEGVTSIGREAFYGCSSLTSVTIPASVTEIGNQAFYGVAPATLVAAAVPSGMSKTNLTSVTIPEGVTSIGKEAFEYCRSLTSVTIPSSVTSIGNWAFAWCYSLTSVTIPSTVTSIGNWAFKGVAPATLVAAAVPDGMSTENLISVTIPEGVTDIGYEAFAGCSSLTSVTIPNSITTIGENAFSGVAPKTLIASRLPSGMSAAALTTLVVLEGTETIAAGAFAGCSALSSVEIPASVTEIGEGAFTGVAPTTLVAPFLPSGMSTAALTTLVFLEGTETIAAGAFAGCSALSSVEIPASVTEIGEGAFTGVAPTTLVAPFLPSGMSTANLMEVTLTAATEIPEAAFAGNTNLRTITLPAGVTAIGARAFEGCSALERVELPSSLAEIGAGAFRGCTGLAEVEIPALVTEIVAGAFAGCSSVTSVVIPASVREIGEGAFTGVAPTTLVAPFLPSGMSTANLTEVTLTTAATVIPEAAFAGNTNLRTITLPAGVASIGARAFEGCTALDRVEIPSSVTEVGAGAFRGCTGVTEVEIPASVTEIAAGAFAGCSALTSVVIPASVTEIAAGAFAGCSALTSVVIPASVTEIGEGAFTGVAPTTLVAPFLPSGMSTANLAEVTLTTAATVIPEAAFAGNEVLRTITLPAGVTSIGARAFEGCSALNRVTIPASVTEIGDGAFRECTGLTEVVFAEGLTKIGDEAFWGCSAVEEMVLPASVTELGGRVFTGCNRVLVAEGNRNYKSVDGVLFSANNEWLLHFPVYQGGEYATPVNVHFIGEEAFMGNTALNFVYLADITTLDPRAFKDCSGLIYCFATEGLLTIQANAFENATSLRAFTVPASVSRLEVGAFKNCTSLSLVAFRGTVPRRTGTVFSGMNLDQMRSTYPSEYAATWETALDGSLMWDGLKMVADGYYTGTSGNYKYRALGGEATITGSTIPLSGAVRLPMMLDDYLVTGIGARAFATSPGLTDITFPRSLLSIGDYAFAFCTKLQTVTFEGAPLTKGTTPTQPFPANTTAIGNYPAELEEAWSQVIEAGYYYGLRMGLVEVLAVLGDGEGEVLGTGSYHIGEEVTLTAVPATGNHFVQWMFLDGTTSTENPITFTADEACYVLVTFEADPAPIVTSNITYENLMGATHHNPATYEEGTEYVFTTPSEVTGYTFQGWQPAAINSSMTGDQTIRATWRANGYTVVYAANGGMGSMANTSAVYDTPFTLSANAFTRSGYTFAGWATSATGGALYMNGAEVSNLIATANGTVTLYAVWAGNAYTIAYHANGGSGTIPEAHVHYGQATTLAQNGFVRPGYTFAGWATSPTGAVAYAPGATVSNLASEAGATITLYALWQVNAYTIVYNANGGEGAMENSSAVYDTPFTLRASTFSRLGYTFKGWATAPQGEVLYADGAAVSNLTEVANGVVPLYAVWEVNAYTIDYVANGGAGKMASTVANYGEGIRLPMMAFTRVGYTFQGWATAPQGEVLYADGAEVRDLTSIAGGTVTLYAIWELNSYTIAYRANGGEGTMTATSATYGQPIALSANAFSRVGHTFLGWATEAEGPVVYADGAEVVNLTELADQEVPLYALWQANSYTIAYNANGGEGEMASTPATYGESLQLPANRFTRTGYTFAGWATEAAGEVAYADNAEVENLTAELNGTITLYATWQANTYTIAYDANGGKGEMAGTLAEYNATVTLRENAFTRVGCAFVGWATEAEGTLRYRDGAEVSNLTAEADGTVTLYALWRTEEYTEGCFFYTLSEAGATLVEYDDEASGASAHVVVPNTLGGYPVVAIGRPGELGDDDYSGFSACHNVVTVTLPATVTTIYDEAFANCSRLESVTIPASVTFLDDGASWGSPNLRYIIDPANAYYASDEHGYLYSKDRTVLMAAPTARGDFVVPDGVVEISECAFFYSRFNSITSVTLPASVRRVRDWAFLDCYNLKTVHFKGEPLDYCGEWAFGDDVLSGTYLPEHQAAWEAVLSNSTWQNLRMSLYLTEPTVEGDPDAVVETDENGQITVKPSEGVGEIVVSIPEGVEAAKVTVEVPSTATSVTANGVTIKVVKVDGETRYDITPFLNIPAAVAGKIDLSQAEVKAEIAKAILDTSEAGGAVFDPSAKTPLTTAATKPGLTYTLLEGDSIDNPIVGESKIGDGQPWQPQVKKQGPSAFYRIRVSK